MSRMCQVCGGLISSPGEVLGWSGPYCHGLHGGMLTNNGISSNDLSSLYMRVFELERKVMELTQRLDILELETPKWTLKLR